jgi:anti-anti-sigma factor
VRDVLHRIDGPNARALVLLLPKVLNHENADSLFECADRWLPNRDDASAVLDFASVTLISTIGIAALLQIEDLCRQRGAAFAIAAVPARQLSLLKMLHLGDRFRTFPTVEDALGAVG